MNKRSGLKISDPPSPLEKGNRKADRTIRSNNREILGSGDRVDFVLKRFHQGFKGFDKLDDPVF